MSPGSESAWPCVACFTVRRRHQAGLFAFDESVDRSVVADLDCLAVVLARQRPACEPRTRQAYHAITLGFSEGELLRRVDPQHRSLGEFVEDEIATPLGEEVYIRLPEEIPNSRLATLATPSPFKMVLDFPIHLTLDGMNHHSNTVLAGFQEAESCLAVRRRAIVRVS